MAGPSIDWHPEVIKAHIRMRGKTLRDLSHENGYQQDACRKTLVRQWPAVERIIADYLGTEPNLIWPSRYTSDGRPKQERTTRFHITKRPPRTCTFLGGGE